MELKCVEFEQNGHKLYSAIMFARDLTNDSDVKVDIYNAGHAEGYQRRPSHLRARDFARYLEKGKGICPTSILLNIRGAFSFEPIKGNFGILKLPDNPDTEKFWIVDGQHRIEGLRELLASDQSYANFPMNVTIMGASTEYEEAKQFIIINKTQVGVRPDLAERFIAKMAKREGPDDLMCLPRATTIDIAWRPKATDIVDILNTRNPSEETNDFYNNPWHRRIQLPNEPRQDTTVSQKAFEDSLKQILHNPSFSSYNAEEIAVILVRYWKAILSICKQADVQPNNYVLMRTTGVAVLHNILPRVVALASKGNNKLTIDRFFAPLSKMTDGMNDLFWESSGIAGNIGTSKKAFSLLTAKLIDYLEEGNKEDTMENKKPFDL